MPDSSLRSADSKRNDKPLRPIFECADRRLDIADDLGNDGDLNLPRSGKPAELFEGGSQVIPSSRVKEILECWSSVPTEDSFMTLWHMIIVDALLCEAPASAASFVDCSYKNLALAKVRAII